MNSNIWLEIVAAFLMLWAAFVSFVPATTKPQKIGYFAVFLVLGLISFVFRVQQSNEVDVQRRAVDKQQQLVQEKLDKTLEQNQRLETQNRDLDTQLMAIREKFGVSASFERDISEEVRTGVQVEATVERGAATETQ
jgi:Na+/melibiose symporter-like transporter